MKEIVEEALGEHTKEAREMMKRWEEEQDE